MFKITVILGLVALSSVLSSPISPTLISSFKTKTHDEIIVTLKERPTSITDIAQKMSYVSRNARLNTVVSALKAFSSKSQKSIQQFLKDEGVQFNSFWISNQIYIERADEKLALALGMRDDVESVTENVQIPLEQPKKHEGILAEWGVEKVQAPQCWNITEGEGAIVGVIDTGARVTHEALAANYVGAAEYGWYDPYLTNTQTPNDNNGHGTHCTGTIAGSGGIGVAPKAKWMACRGCSTVSCGAAQLTSCGQFMSCPHDPRGNNPDCSKAPNIVSNSWGGALGTWFNDVMNAWTAQGIFGVFAYGNSGPNCNSGSYPGGNPNAIACGATDSNDNIAEFSSRGPAVTGIRKPEISAPGVAVRSSTHESDSTYTSYSGTSMATPHVAGVLALLVGYDQNLSITNGKNAIFNNADRNLPSTGTFRQSCGGVDENTYPNNVYGNGRINAKRALDSLMGKK